MRILFALLIALPLYGMANEIIEYVLIALLQLLAGLDFSLNGSD